MIKNTYSTLGKQSVHALFFFSFVIIGFVVLSFAKLVALMPIFLVLISAGLMTTYAFCIVFVPAMKLRLDVAGDNMYYLGFLYTLSSLAVAITISEAEQILANFGVAISSTIIGIAARVAFNQMRIDPHDVEGASRVELSEATRRVTDELNETVLQLTKFRTMTMQVMAEGYEDVQKTVENSAKEIFESLKETSGKNAAILSEIGRKSSEEQSKLSESILNLKASNEELVSANKGMVSQISSTSDAYKALAVHYSDTRVLEGKIIDEIKSGIDSMQVTISSDIVDNIKISEAQFEKNILKALSETALGQKEDLKNASEKVIESLQKTIEENSSVSSDISDLKNKFDADEEELNEGSSWYSPTWFKRQ